jgi:hypothetical protein
MATVGHGLLSRACHDLVQMAPSKTSAWRGVLVAGRVGVSAIPDNG